MYPFLDQVEQRGWRIGENRMGYRERVVDDEIVRLLKKTGAIILKGPKAVGKTETATQHSASIVCLDTDLNARALAKAAPMMLLQEPTPRLVDEWQVERSVWNAIRREVDKRGQVAGLCEADAK